MKVVVVVFTLFSPIFFAYAECNKLFVSPELENGPTKDYLLEIIHKKKKMPEFDRNHNPDVSVDLYKTPDNGNNFEGEQNSFNRNLLKNRKLRAKLLPYEFIMGRSARLAG